MSHLYNNQSQSPVHHTPLHTGRGWGWVRWISRSPSALSRRNEVCDPSSASVIRQGK